MGKLVEQRLIDQVLEMVLIFDKMGRIEYANQKAKEYLEYDFDDGNVNISDVFPADFLDENTFTIDISKWKNKLKQTMMYRQNRTCFAVEISVLENLEYEERYICCALDVSKRDYFERKANQVGQEEEATQQVKTQFVANVTHELRTPVNGILGNVQELIKREEDKEKRKLLDLMERGCNDMHAIINNILDFSKLDAGKLILENRQFNFREMMEYIRSNHINKITEKGLQLFVTIAPNVPEWVIGDELRIKQILNNLLSNATKFTMMGKIVVEVIKTAQIDHRIELFFMVIDTGIGIAKEDQDKLFKSFSQVEASTTRKFGGTGLGLNISKQLVELMDGNIHVESERNKGTMFSFHIWLDVPLEETQTSNMDMQSMFEVKMPTLIDFEEADQVWQYGTRENIEELQKKMSKLILSVEMDNWEKAELFMDTVKELTQDAPREVKSAILRLKMAVQKADYDKTIIAFDVVKELIPDK